MSDLREKLGEVIDTHVGNFDTPEFSCMAGPKHGFETCVQQITSDYALADAIIAAMPYMMDVRPKARG